MTESQAPGIAADLASVVSSRIGYGIAFGLSAGIASPESDPAFAATSAPACAKRPVRLLRTCVATHEYVILCGCLLALEAHLQGFNQASRRAYVGDGQACNWTIWKDSFQRQGYVRVLDFIHLLTFVHAVAMAVGRAADDGCQWHVRWITALWSGGCRRAYGVPIEQALPDNEHPSPDPARADAPDELPGAGQLSWVRAIFSLCCGGGGVGRRLWFFAPAGERCG